MKIYIAARYDRRYELRDVATQLANSNHEITSRWLDNGEESKSQVDGALMDLEDVDRADIIVFYAQQTGSFNKGGERWFEFGYAYAKGKPVIVVLPEPVDMHESVFTALIPIVCYSNEMLIDKINQLYKE